jgi:predicted nucleic acid-binding protein
VKEYVLDANALVRLFREAPGADAVENLIRQAKSGRARLSISVVNLTEVLYILARFFGQEKALLCIDRARRVAEPTMADEQVAIDSCD